MKYKHMMVWGVLLLIISCAAVEPTRVENGLYINPAYQFCLRVPAGWETSEEIPGTFAKSMPSTARQKKFEVTFSDLKNKRIILVGPEKTEGDWVSFKMQSDKLITSLDKSLAKAKKKLLEDPRCIFVHYEIYQDQIENCDSDCVAAKMDFQGDNLKGSIQWLLYKSDNGMVYILYLVLIAHEEGYASSLRIFEMVVDSFQHR